MIPMTDSLKNYEILPGGHLTGVIQVPGDKSISHRAIMLGAIAEGQTHISGFLEGADCLATLQAFRTLGVNITDPNEGKVRIEGVGLTGLKAPMEPLDLGNSGTSMRLLTGILAGQKFDSILTGDASLQKRPMARIAVPLQEMGAQITLQAGNVPPIYIKGNQTLKGIHYQMPMPSAQVKSCLLLAGLYAEGETRVTEPALTRDHTERMLGAFGVEVKTKGSMISIEGGQSLLGTQIKVPADISSAAFFMVGASIATGSNILLKNVGINPCRSGVLNILSLMGADFEILNSRFLGLEPVADIRFKSSALMGIEIPIGQVPLAIDEFPALFIAAACAKGVTTLRKAEELRVKESDRIQVMAEGLQTLGIKAQVLADGIQIEGGKIKGGTINSYGDHRIAMAFAMAGLVAAESIIIQDCANVDTSFPDFAKMAQQSGVNLRVTTNEK